MLARPFGPFNGELPVAGGIDLRVYENYFLHEMMFYQWDVLKLMLLHPGKVVFADRGDEQFYHRLTVEGDTYHWDQWGSQGKRPCALTDQESELLKNWIAQIPDDYIEAGKLEYKVAEAYGKLTGSITIMDFSEFCPDCLWLNTRCDCDYWHSIEGEDADCLEVADSTAVEPEGFEYRHSRITGYSYYLVDDSGQDV